MQTVVPFNEMDLPRAQRGRQKEISHLAARTTTQGAQPRVKFQNTFSSCMMRRIWKCHRGGFSGFDANQAFLSAAKTALTIFLKFCIPPKFGLNFLMKKIFDPPKRIMKSFWGSKNPENQFFRPKSDIFHPISTKLSKSVKNIKIHKNVCFYILNIFGKFCWNRVKIVRFRSKKLIFGVFGPPKWRHRGVRFGSKYDKMCVLIF